MASPRVRGKKMMSSLNGKLKKGVEGSKERFENKSKETETTLRMLIMQAHEIHKGFYKRNQAIRKSQSFVDLKSNQNKTSQEIRQTSDGKGDAGPISKPTPIKIKKRKLKPNSIKSHEKSLEKIPKPSPRSKPVKKLRKTSKESKEISIRKIASDSSVDEKSKPSNKPSKNVMQRFAQKGEIENKNVMILFEKEFKEEQKSEMGMEAPPKPAEKKVFSPEEIFTNIQKIWSGEEKNELGDNYSKTNSKFIETLFSLGHKVLNIKPEAKKEESVKILKKFEKNSENCSGNNSSVLTWESISGDIKEIWGKEKADIPQEKMDEELKSYRELKKLVNDELLRIWKPHEKVEVKKEEKAEVKVEVEEEKKEEVLKPGRIIVKPNPTSYLEKRALSTKANYTSLIRKLDSEKVEKDKKEVKNTGKQWQNWNIVKKLENAFETLGSINWEPEPEPKTNQPKIKEEEVSQSILQRIQDHKETIASEITKTEKKINEKFGSPFKDPKTKKSTKEKPLEIYFRRSLEEIDSSNGLVAETERECKELTRKIIEDFKNNRKEKKFSSKKSFAPISRVIMKNEGADFRHKSKKLDPIDKKIQQDLKLLGLVNHRKSDSTDGRLKDLVKEKRPNLQGDGVKIKDCSGWRKKRDRSRSISRSIGSEGPNDQALPPVPMEEDATLTGKLATDGKPTDGNMFSSTGNVGSTLEKIDSADKISIISQVLQESNNTWNKNLEDPGGPSTSSPRIDPIYVNLEEFKYRKGDPSFRHFGSHSMDPSAPLTKTEEEALRRQRELKKILHKNEENFKFVMEEFLPKQSYEDKKLTNHRRSIIVDHNSSWERIDENDQAVLGHAQKLIVKEDAEHKKTAKVQFYGKGIRRVSEPVYYAEDQLREKEKLRRNFRKSMYDEPGLDIRRTESKDVECQTDSNDDDLENESDLFSIDE